jgi:apolipoprotein N-acyltransferase
MKVGLISEGVASTTTGRRDRARRFADLAALQAASAEAEAAGARLLVWTETGFPFDLPRTSTADLGERSPYRLRRGFSLPLVFGALTEDKGGPLFNSATLLGVDGRFTARHDKVHRVFGSEYNPVVEAFPSLETLMPAGAGHFAAGDAPVMLPIEHDGRLVRLAPMICFADILPGHGRALAAERPHLLVNLTNDSWFGPQEPLQHLALAVFRSVELRTDMVRAVNLGPSTHVDATGRIRAAGSMDHRGPEALVVDAALVEGGATVYARVGNLFGWGCAALTLFLWLVAPRLAARRSPARAPRPARRRR